MNLVEKASSDFATWTLAALEVGASRTGRMALSKPDGLQPPGPALPADFLGQLPRLLPSLPHSKTLRHFRKSRTLTDPGLKDLLGSTAKFWWFHFTVWSRMEIKPNRPETLRYVLDAYLLMGRSVPTDAQEDEQCTLEIVNTDAEIHHYYRSDRKVSSREFSRITTESFVAETLVPALVQGRSPIGSCPPFGVGITLMDGPTCRLTALGLPPLDLLGVD